MKRKKLREYLGKDIVIYAKFKDYAREKQRFEVLPGGLKKAVTDRQKTICIIGIISNLLEPLSDHAWIKGERTYNRFKDAGIRKGDFFKATTTIIEYGDPIRYGFDHIHNIEKIVDEIPIKQYYEILEEMSIWK